MVYLVLYDPTWGSPCKLMGFLVREECSPDHEPIRHTEVTKHFSILIHDSFTVGPHGCFPVCIVRAHLCIQVTNNHGEVSRLSLVEGSLKLVIEVLLLFLSSVIRWCVYLNDCGVLALGFEPGRDNSLRDWLPIFQTPSGLL